jgi:hypothetical protein
MDGLVTDEQIDGGWFGGRRDINQAYNEEID